MFVTYDELIGQMMASSADDWLANDERSIWTFKHDLNVTLRGKSDINFDERQPFREEWAQSFPDQNAYATEYELWYGASFVKPYYFVDVDGYRASLPYPAANNDLTITQEQLAVARIVNGHRSHFQEYIKGFTVEG